MRRTPLLLAALLLGAQMGCGTVDKLTGQDSSSSGLTTAALEGQIVGFTNPNPNTTIGEHADWDYSFRSPTAVACNELHGYVADSWVVIDSKTVRVYYGSDYEQYELKSMQGSLAGGDLRGTFHLTSSVAANVVDGTFQQISSFRFNNCP